MDIPSLPIEPRVAPAAIQLDKEEVKAEEPKPEDDQPLEAEDYEYIIQAALKKSKAYQLKDEDESDVQAED